MSVFKIKSNCFLKRFPTILRNFKFNYSIFEDPLNLQTVAMAYKKYDVSPNDTNPPIIILHGIFGSKSNWNSLCKTLANKKLNRNVIAVDARNHGESPHSHEFSYYHLVADLNRFLNDMRINKACLIGHSMGGRAMMLFALIYPQKAEKLIVLDITPFDSSKSVRGMKYYFNALRSIQLPSTLPLSQGRNEADSQLEKFIDDREIRQFLLTNLVKDEDGNFGWRINLDSIAANFEERIVKFPENLKSKYDNPTLFIGGLQSDYMSKSDEKPIMNIFPAAKFTYLDCGHWVHAEKPQEFLDITTKFIKTNQI